MAQKKFARSIDSLPPRIKERLEKSLERINTLKEKREKFKEEKKDKDNGRVIR